ncbi:MAG TPA: ATP-binding protein [Chloroflexota bacterium]|nr:ATP-binding protein [Chloroflexota bacterium]
MKKKHQPHWQHENWQHGEWPEQWSGKPAGLFVWFMFVFGTLAVLLLGMGGLLIYWLVTAVIQSDTIAAPILLSMCGSFLLIPLLLRFIGGRAFAGVGTVAQVMAAADKVAEGDFTVRVLEKEGRRGRRRGRFARLARSFNQMTAALQQADEQRRNLTADVAHELRTPLHIIQGNLEGILDGVYEPTPAHIQATLEETHLLARLVDDLHTLAQAEAGQLSLHLAPVDVTELLADVQTSFSGLTEEKGLSLTVSFDGKPAELTIAGDAERLDQVLGNLVANALRHTPPGGGITLHAARLDGMVQIQVQDTGEGISANDLPYVFDRFWRGDRARTRTDGSGGGLGLAIVKQLVEAHHGRVAVNSAPGEGTIFTLSFPAV